MDSVHSRSWTWPTAMALALLAACGGDALDVQPAPGRTDGLLWGNVKRGGSDYGISAFASGGRFMAVDAGGAFYDGTYSISNGLLSGTGLRIYAVNTGAPTVKGFSETGTITAKVTPGDGWDGKIVTAGNATITFILSYDTGADAQDSSLGITQGTWTYADEVTTSTLSIDSGGNTASTNSSGCTSGGTVSTIDTNFNIYGSQTTVSGNVNCPSVLFGSYTGLITVDLAAAPNALAVMLAKTDYMVAYRYTRQ